MKLFKNIHLGKSPKDVSVSFWGEAPVSYDVMIAEIQNAQTQAQHEVNEFLEGLDKSYGELVDGIMAKIPHLLNDMLKRILVGVELDQEQIKRVVDDMLASRGRSEGKLKVYLCPSDYNKFINDATAREYPKVEFESQESLRSGDCVLESSFGVNDGRIDTKVDQITGDLVHE